MPVGSDYRAALLRSIDSFPSTGASRSTSTCSLSIRPEASSVCSDGGVRLFGGGAISESLLGSEYRMCRSQFVASMRHQAADRARGQQIAGHSAKDPLVEPAVAVSPGHQQIGTFVLGERDDLIRTRSLRLYFDPTLRPLSCAAPDSGRRHRHDGARRPSDPSRRSP